jgi:hypothetical protein
MGAPCLQPHANSRGGDEPGFGYRTCNKQAARNSPIIKASCLQLARLQPPTGAPCLQPTNEPTNEPTHQSISEPTHQSISDMYPSKIGQP